MSTTPKGRTAAWLGLALVGIVIAISAAMYATCAHLEGGTHQPSSADAGGLARASASSEASTVARPRPPDSSRPGPDLGRAVTAPGSEEQLMVRLRQQTDPHPGAALALARLGEARFPSSRFADERAWLKMRALVHLGQIAPARDEAQLFFERFPHSPYGERVYRLTGVHPRPRPGPRR